MFSKHPLHVVPHWLLGCKQKTQLLPSQNLQPLSKNKGGFAKTWTRIPNRIPQLPGIFIPSLLRTGCWFMIIKQVVVLNVLLNGMKADPLFVIRVLKEAFDVFGSSQLLQIVDDGL